MTRWSGKAKSSCAESRVNPWLRFGRGSPRSFGLLSDHFIRDFVVRGLRNDFLADKVGLDAIRAGFNDFLGVGVANSGEFLELILRCGVEVDQAGFGGAGGCRLRF